MEMYFNLFILIVVYLIAEVAKNIMTKIKKDKYRDLLPHICMLFGATLSIVLLYTYPKALSEGIDNPIQAFICGALSGVAATGSNQLFSRTVKFKKTLSSSFEFDGYSDTQEEEIYNETEDIDYTEEC